MQKLIYITLLVMASFMFAQAQTSTGAEIVSHQRFGQGMMVTKAKIVPLSGVVSNIFFFNRQDEPWNGNVWYEYDWEIRGRFPSNGWSQIRVREHAGGQLRSAPVNISTSENLGQNFYHYVLIRKGNEYVYDIREDFDINSYNYNNAGAHGGNSASIIVGGPRVYSTGGALAHIPEFKTLDFSLGITSFDNSWSGALPGQAYSGDLVVDFTRFYGLSGNNFNTNPQWQDEFNNGSLDYGKWFPADWTFGDTQFTPNNLRFENGHVIMTIKRDQNNSGNSNTNLALNGQAKQSTTAHNGSANRAIDNNTNGKWSNQSVTHTHDQTNSWWEVELAGESDLNKIVLHNRTDCCTDRLSDFSVSVLDDNDKVVWTKFYSLTPNAALTINLDAVGSKVRINRNGVLSLAEVQIFGTQLTTTPVAASNLALNGTASQSSTNHGGSASRANDNNTNGLWRNRSVTHTSNENNAWWQVELAQNSTIEEIVLFNRADNCCTSRLSDFTVSVLDASGNSVWSRSYTNPPASSLAIDLDAVGKTVRVTLDGTLSLAEVQVFGTPASTTSNAVVNNHFAARKIPGRVVELNWMVDYTRNPVQYEVEKLNANGEYEVLEIIASEGVDDFRLYDYLDSTPDEGANTYRIKVIYLHESEYLDPLVVEFDPIYASKVYPNPTAGLMYIDMTNYMDLPVDVTVTDQAGVVLINQKFDQYHERTVNMDLTKLQNGFYIVRLKAGLLRAESRKITLMQAY